MSEEREPYRGPYGKRNDEPPKLDTYSGRPVNQELPLLECAALAVLVAEDIIVREAWQRRVNAGLGPCMVGATGLPDPIEVRKADALEQLAKLARAIAGPDGSRAARIIPKLKRLVAEEKRRESNQ